MTDPAATLAHRRKAFCVLVRAEMTAVVKDVTILAALDEATGRLAFDDIAPERLPGLAAYIARLITRTRSVP